MYFSGLKKAIESLEEKRFYDVALLYLREQGYNDVRIVDGSGDGGRDVVTSRESLRIQLSVRKDWESKINSETASTLSQGKRHLLYITNRAVSEKDRADFLVNRYKQAGEVEVTIVDLNALASTLSLPGVIRSTCEVLGFQAGTKVVATAADVAISSYLLFSKDARELKQEIYECNIKACIYKNGPMPDRDLIDALRSSLPGQSVETDVPKYRASLQSREILAVKDGLNVLLPHAYSEMQAAEQEYLSSIEADISRLRDSYGITDADAKKLVEITLELVARGEKVDGGDVYSVELLDFISNKGLVRKKDKLFEDLSALSQARIKAYGAAVNHIFSSNTFDIYRALGKNSKIVMVLDSSVAMPMIFGLSFGPANSRYGLAASALHELCSAHGVEILVPRCYLNEMAGHGQKALRYLEDYQALNSDLKDYLRESGNAYLSHFSHLRRRGALASDFDLTKFLKFFGLVPGASIGKVENYIETILNNNGISIVDEGRYEPQIREAISELKPHEDSRLVDHDARVATFLRGKSDVGFIFATWDKALTEVMEGLSRIYADNPANIRDFLSMAVGSDYESRQSVSLLTTLLYIDDRKAAKIAAKIEKIKGTDRIYELNEIIVETRSRDGSDDSVEDAVGKFLSGLDE